MKSAYVLCGVAASVFAAAPASAAVIQTATTTYSGLGSTIGGQFDILTFNGTSSTVDTAAATITLSNLDFTAGLTGANSGGTTTGSFTNSITIGGAVFSYVIPYSLTIGSSVDSITLLATTFSRGGFNFATNAVTLNSGGATVRGALTANVAAAVPEPGTWGLMLLGFGAVGAAMRRQRRVKAVVSFA
jgi:hypothetical protein